MINIDAELLRRSSQSALHAAEQTRLHIASEFGANVPSIMGTLKAEGPYRYVIFPDVQPDRSVRLPIHTTREEVRQAYELTWATSHMLAFQPVIELRGTWYTFNEALSTVCLNDTGTWYLFAELRLTGRLRAPAGATVAFHTAELFVPANDGRFIARIGHGTDPA